MRIFNHPQIAIILLSLALTAFSFAPSKVCGQTVMTLEKALEIAKVSSPDIKRSVLNLESNRKSLDAQHASLKSKFSLEITPFDFSRSRVFDEFFSTWNTSEDYNSFGTFSVIQPITKTDGTLSLINRLGYRDNFSEFQDVRTKTYSNNLYLQLEQPIFTYNRTRLQLKELELNLENAQINHAMQLLNLEKNVTQSFYDVYQQQNSLQIARDELENQQTSYDITKNKVEAGLSAKEELYQAELNLASSKSKLQNQQVALENAKDNFKVMIGISVFEQVSVLADVTLSPYKINLEEAIQHGLDQRMELRQREISIERSQFELIRTNAQNEFKGNISLSMGVFGDDSKFSNVYESPTNNPRVAVSFNIPLWDWGEKKARLDASRADLEVSKIDLSDQKNDIIITMRQVYRSLQNLEMQIEIARQNVENAELTYEINLERYQNGDLTSMDLNQFQIQLSDKKIALSNALINYKLELLNLKIQSLWDFETQQSILNIPLEQKN
ncbi:TolC family protein [Fulvivirgaceae bacterium BMA12]|uniref:TolC family protein n=1 Tax=Agaribacillus aureus TaxID=3051825 RepID=A0ABT8LEW6_9BACT|nr:TolC family protein [Fulvivirgaceae bacterium BMA12]